jgi:autophagy-related protein 11
MSSAFSNLNQSYSSQSRAGLSGSEYMWKLTSSFIALEDSIANASHLLESYIRAATAHHDFVAHTLTSLHYQHESLRIASTNLDLHVLSLSDAFDQFAQSASKEFDRQATLLTGISADLDIISKLYVHPELLSSNAKRGKTLGDYVSRQKMKLVVDTCAKQHSRLHIMRFRGCT